MFSRFVYFKKPVWVSACAHGLINTVSQISFSLVSKRTEILIYPAYFFKGYKKTACFSARVSSSFFKSLIVLHAVENLKCLSDNTSKPGGRIPIYKPYGCVPLILKGKDVSVLVPHPHPASHRVPSLPYTLEYIHQIPALFFLVYSINQMTSFS